MIDRRRFLLSSVAGVVALPPAAGAKQAAKVARAGILSVDTAPAPEAVAKSPFFAALRYLRWIAGQNIVFEVRSPAGQTDRLPALAAELVRLKVDLIVTFLNQETLAAKQASASVPIVMVLGVYAVEAGLVGTLARPGGNVTGRSITINAELVGKRLGYSKKRFLVSRGLLGSRI